MKPSAYTSTTTVPVMCNDGEDDHEDCYDKPFDWALNSWSTKTNFGGDVGLARDGHVIVGPYNEDGELWSCDDHDICNGAFLSTDSAYVYVSTSTFPYFVGCWGPAHPQTMYASCS